MSQITIHILDTAKGAPASGISTILYQQRNEEWKEIALGTTNIEGRIANLLDDDVVLEKGTYKIKFETEEYFSRQTIQTFYPFVEIVFNITTNEHYHIPLLLNAFGYSTYRGT